MDIAAELPQLLEIPTPPKELFIRGSLERTIGTKFVTIVGSRKYSEYGKAVCKALVEGLASYPVTIVSGLAIGIDTIAHKAALEHDLPTIAFPGSGLHWSAIYPRQHEHIAKQIVAHGGALISEFTNDMKAAPWMFPQRNRLEAGISDITIVIEAEKQSGTLITARLATDYNKTVGAVPGTIYTPTAHGPNYLLRLGAIPITSPEDIIQELGFEPREQKILPPLTAQEEKVLKHITSPVTYDILLEELSIDQTTLSITLSSLEIKGYIRETLGLIERCQ